MLRIIMLVAAIVAAGCVNSPTGPDAVVGKPFELKVGAVSELPNGARLRFERVAADSRCPMDAMCVWAGDATVMVTVNPSAGGTESLELHVQPAGSQVSYANYIITLSALAPYPQKSQEIRPGDYIATFVVSVR
jgi:hypothetical protein